MFLKSSQTNHCLPCEPPAHDNLFAQELIDHVATLP
jgi:hypothetical protein